MADLIDRLREAAKRAAYYQTGEEALLNEAIAALESKPAKPDTYVFLIRRVPITAGAKRAAGYGPVDFEITATSEGEAVAKAIAMCQWNDPGRNFSWRAVGTKAATP